MGAVLRKALLHLIAMLLSWHALLLYGFPLPALLAVWVVLSVGFLFAGGAQAMLTGVTLAVFTLLLNFVVGVTGLERGIYYRPHEFMKSSDPEFGEIYKPNSQISMNALFGDIEAMEKVGIQEAHEIAYRTDSLGFRNPSDYRAEQKFVFVGDSFVAGANDTQDCLLTEWLRREHKLDTYNLGFPGDLNDYVNRAMAFRKAKGNDFRMALFIFEGNDFRPFTHRPIAKPILIERYYGIFKDSSLWRYTRSLYLRGVKKKDGYAATAPQVREIGGNPIAFYSQNQAIANNPNTLQESDLRFIQAFEALKPNLIQIFFIPVKYRVYAPWLSRQATPNEQWNYLARAAQQAGIPAFDLTPALTAEAARLLPQGQYVYWRDDTHWNCNGMRIAAVQVARILDLH